MLQRLAIVAFAAVFTVASTVGASANPRYAAFVMDANTGQVLFSRNGDAQRFPASLTKMMTLYLAFEAIEDGRITKSSRVPVSANAAAEPPSKVGVRAGRSVTVEEAILALVTKSANDLATALGEFIGGSETAFARMMTAKARQLGMNSTTFRNAHGLPNSGQVTTARDMAILGIALREHFPQHYSYFSTRNATVAGQRFGNHNRVLGRVQGADGIKTGYIRASGFNLVSSVQSGGRSIVAVVMGGQSGKSRDDHMVALIREHLPRATTRRGGPLLSPRGRSSAPLVASAGPSLPSQNIPTPSFRPGQTIAIAKEIAPTAYAAASAAPAAPMPIRAPVPQVEIPVAEGSTTVDPVTTASTSPSGGWAVQIAAAHSQGEAMTLLSRTKEQAPDILGNAQPFTETFKNNGTTFFRARFGGFNTKDAAWNTCNALKKKRIDCYAVQL